jgi:hypothetical protein
VASPTDKPWVDNRLFSGILVVLGTQWLFWFIAGAIWIGGRGTAQDFFLIIFVCVVFSIPLVSVFFIIALGPGVALWSGIIAACRFARLTERQSALIAAPTAAVTMIVGCLFVVVFAIGNPAGIDINFIGELMLFSIPAAITAEIYAFFAWPRISKHEESAT